MQSQNMCDHHCSNCVHTFHEDSKSILEYVESWNEDKDTEDERTDRINNRPCRLWWKVKVKDSCVRNVQRRVDKNLYVKQALEGRFKNDPPTINQRSG